MKILHIFYNYLPTTQQWAFQLLNHAHGVEHHIAALNHQENSFWNPEFKLLKAPQSNQLDNLKAKIVTLFSNQKKRNQYLQNRGKQKLENFIDNSLKSYIQSQSIQLIHVHFANFGYKFIRLKKIFPEIPYVVSFYGMDYEYYPTVYPEYKEYYKILYKEADAFICEGEHGKKILTKNGVNPDKVHVVRLGINVNDIPFHKRDKQSGQLKLIQVASFVKKKGHIYTLKAVKAALAKCPNLHLTLIGKPNSLRTEIEEFIKENNLESTVTFIDFIDYKKIHQFFKKFDAFIHPSCYTDENDCEGGAPIVLLDAQATGLPVISTTHCDIPGEVIHQKTGLLSEEKKIDGIAKNIQIFYEMNKDEYLNYSKNAQMHVVDKFDARKCSEKLVEVYKEFKNIKTSIK